MVGLVFGGFIMKQFITDLQFKRLGKFQELYKFEELATDEERREETEEIIRGNKEVPWVKLKVDRL